MEYKDNVIWDRLEYAVISVTITSSPRDCENTPWHQYIVGRSNACLICKSRGSFEEVSAHARQLALDLNARRSLKKMNYGRNLHN